MGSYVVFIDTAATLHDTNPFVAPHTRGVKFHDVFAVWISGSGGDDSIIDGAGGPVTSTTPGAPVLSTLQTTLEASDAHKKSKRAPRLTMPVSASSHRPQR